MRLLDLVAQGRGERIIASGSERLPGVEAFSVQVQACPIRYVLEDELARCAMELALAEGDRLYSCLDLIRVPATNLWIEWRDAARRLDAWSVASSAAGGDADIQHAGVLVNAARDGRSGALRTFWSTRKGLAYCSPVTVWFDLEGDLIDVARDGVQLAAPETPGLDGLLGHLR